MPEIPPAVISYRKGQKAPPSRFLLGILHRRFLLLFLFLLATLALYPVAENSSSGYLAFRIVGAAVILLSVYAIGFRRILVILGLVLAIPALLKHLLGLSADAGALPLLGICLSFAFDVFIIVVMFRRVFSREKPDSETVFGALCIYMLVGFSFTGMYGMVATLHPHAFYMSPQINTHVIPNRFDFIDYSFGTLSTVGCPGIIAVGSGARSLTVIEAMLGVFYLAVLIARLMGAYRGVNAAEVTKID